MRELCPKVNGAQREEPGSAKGSRECGLGQVSPGEVTLELYVKDELESRARERWVKAWKHSGARRLVDQKDALHLVTQVSRTTRGLRQSSEGAGVRVEALSRQTPPDCAVEDECGDRDTVWEVMAATQGL